MDTDADTDKVALNLNGHRLLVDASSFFPNGEAPPEPISIIDRALAKAALANTVVVDNPDEFNEVYLPRAKVVIVTEKNLERINKIITTRKSE